MGELIDDLLIFSRLGRQAISIRDVDLVPLVRQVVDEVRQEYPGRNVEVTINDLVHCQGDPVLLKQVFVNLINNAFKYTRIRDAATVEVGSQHLNGEDVYYVKDNGVGFDMRYASKLFGVFQRLHRVEDYPGTGVGLAIVHRIITRHGGRIWAEAEPDRGAGFFFTLGSVDNS